jgi:hypothetical protein
MSLTLDGTNGISASGGVNVLQDDSVVTGNLVDGAVTVPKIGATGTPDDTTFLRGDGAWATIETTPTTDQVLTATAGASVGAVGTYAFLGFNTGTSALSIGSTTAGSNLRYAVVGSSSSWNVNFLDNLSGHGDGGTPAGTWRAMGGSSNTGRIKATIWLRIS